MIAALEALGLALSIIMTAGLAGAAGFLVVLAVVSKW